jgi:integrase
MKKELNKTLDTFSYNGITSAIIYDTRRSKKDKTYPVKYRVTYLRDRVYFSSGINLSEEEWVRIPVARGKDLREQRELIQSGFEKIKLNIKELCTSDQGFSFSQLNTKLSKGMKNSVFVAYDVKVEELKKVGKLGTADWYYYSGKSLGKYSEHDLKFSEITTVWLRKYEEHLLSEGKSYTTISMYMRALQAIVNEAKTQGVIAQTQYPFGKDKYEIPEEESRKMALTLAQIKKIIDFPLLTDSEKRCRDLWFFSYMCNGINMIDLLHLKFSNLSKNEIHFYRLKTITRSKKKKEIVATLSPQMKQIIDKWGNSEHKDDNYIFPFLSDGLDPEAERRILKNVTRLVNKKMSIIGKALGYGLISTYSARHSFASVLKRSGANIAYISDSLGHSDINITERYLDSFEEGERIKNSALLTNFKNTKK